MQTGWMDDLRFYVLFNSTDADQEIPTFDQLIMPETRQTSFPALCVYPRVGISRTASETNDRLHFSLTLAAVVAV